MTNIDLLGVILPALEKYWWALLVALALIIMPQFRAALIRVSDHVLANLVELIGVITSGFLLLAKQATTQVFQAVEVNHVQKIAAEALRKPYFSNDCRRLVWRNPDRGFYECFFNKDKEDPYSNNLVHHWVWKKHTGSYPKPGNEINHKDGNKYNNDFSNLEELPKEEHRSKHARNEVPLQAKIAPYCLL